MKKLTTILAAVFITASVLAQAPQKMSYQAVIRNSSNALITSTAVGMQISILQGSATGTSVYVETQTPITNANGLVSLEIGSGTIVTGTFSDIDWANGPYFIKTETDPAGGTNYTITGTSQLLSVPYALYAENVSLVKGQKSYNLYITDGGELVISSKIQVEKPYSLVPTVTDLDGNVYGTVKIGTQVWMAENLKVTKYRNGSAIPTTSSTSIPNDSTSKYQWAYNDNDSNVAIYGRLYTWWAVTDSRNVCPAGWHLPTDDEWTILTDYLGNNIAGGRMKETGTSHWTTPNADATNESGFSALPGGYRYTGGTFGNLGYSGTWWSSTELNAAVAWDQSLGYSNSSAYRDYDSKSVGFSVRCLRD